MRITDQTEILQPIQPYWVLDTDALHIMPYGQLGICLFYTFRLTAEKSVRVVPDGCIDLLFCMPVTGSPHVSVCGTALRFSAHTLEPGKYFGVRFLPGYHPPCLKMDAGLLPGAVLPLESENTRKFFLAAASASFEEQVSAFLALYPHTASDSTPPYGRQVLLRTLRLLIYRSAGRIQVQEMETETGYTTRYINRVFREGMGYPPKVFCKMIQFQSALHLLGEGFPDKMTDTAAALGYYDEPQFIRDFKNYSGMTPKHYLTLAHSPQFTSAAARCKYKTL